MAITTRMTAPSSSERQVISRAIDGDEEAFGEIFRAHKNHVFSLCLRMTGNVGQAEDLTQDTFLHVFRKLATFCGESALSTWIYRVAVNTTLMQLRKKAHHTVSLDERLSQDPPKERLEMCREDGRLHATVDRVALIRAIGELPQGYRTVFLLHEVEGYGHREIADLLKCSTGNSKSQLHKARLKIHALLTRVSVRQYQPTAANLTRVRTTAADNRSSSEELSARPSKLLPLGLPELEGSAG